MVHASELTQNLDWPNAHTINHADYLSDLYTDTCIDKENHEADTNIDFGLLTTKDIDPYLNCTDNCIELSACTLTCSNHLSHMYSISSDHQPNHPSSHGDTAASALQQTDKQDTGRELIQTKVYPYIAHVMALESCVPLNQGMQLPATAEQIVTPLKLDNWITAMATYPDPQFVSYIANGIQHGFRVDFQYSSVQCNSAKANAKSALLHPEPMSDY